MNSEKRLNNKGVGAGAGADAGVACGKIRSTWPPATSVLWHLLAVILGQRCTPGRLSHFQ